MLSFSVAGSGVCLPAGAVVQGGILEKKRARDCHKISSEYLAAMLCGCAVTELDRTGTFICAELNRRMILCRSVV